MYTSRIKLTDPQENQQEFYCSQSICANQINRAIIYNDLKMVIFNPTKEFCPMS